MTDMRPLVEVCRDILDNQHEADVLRARRDAFLRGLIEATGLSYQKASVEVIIALRDAGLTGEQIDRVGVSPSAVRIAVDKGKGTT